jgi:hypothetical protein
MATALIAAVVICGRPAHLKLQAGANAAAAVSENLRLLKCFRHFSAAPADCFVRHRSVIR